ncbi:MAG TPA: transglycosylase domain-containing protein [Gaiellaceae bacterium]|nr:transglycosylase domain-containing protein [Gaiellaceae bacterium]
MPGAQGPNGGGRGRWQPPPRHDLELERLFAVRHARVRRLRRRRRSVLLLLTLLLASTLTLFLATVAFTGPQLLASMCSLSDLRPLSLGSNSFLYTDNGNLLGVVPSATNRQPLPLSQMSPWLAEATVAIEDARFWEHGALDYQGIMRAIYDDVTTGQIQQGASTLTQQLVRNLYIGNPQRTFSRKLKEACLAEKVFQRLSRKQILAAYLNEVFYGRHAYGAQAASQTYFSESASQLTLSQAALLAGLPQAPTSYDPALNPRDALARRNEVLRAMLKNGYITSGQFTLAKQQPLGLKLGNLYTQQHQPNYFGWATQQLVDRFGERQVERGGLKVTTTLDPRLQALALHAVADVLRTRTDPAAAVVAIDPQTGAVKAMVDYLPDGRQLQFNLATQAHRSTGSAFKPITLATALTEGVSLYSTFVGPPELLITDPQCATNGGPWDVHNSGDESAGTMDLIDATANSVNTIFAQLIAKVGVSNVVKMGHWLGITSSGNDFKPVCAITLGSVGFTPLELTDVYATLASGGIHHTPQAFLKVVGPHNKVLGSISSPGRRILSPNVDNEITYALEGVITHGTGTAAAIGRPAAGKTGTAENYQDAWFCGYVPQLATCVWVGYPAGEIPLVNVEGVYDVFGGTLPAEIWHDFMGPAVAPYPVKSFATPTIGGTIISGTGTFAYAPGYSPTTSTSTTTTATTTSKKTTPPGHKPGH